MTPSSMPTRRTTLLTLLGGAATSLPGARFRSYSRCLPDHLTALAVEAYQRRNAALAKLTTPPLVRARQQWVRKTLWSLIGGQPSRTPLEIHPAGSFARNGYRVEKFSFESRPGVRIPANLYIPTNAQPPFPGVLFQMGHSLNGKAYPSYQKCCQGLARLGYLVLAFDPMGQGERTYYGTGDADEEHSRAGRQMLLLGDTATRLQLWDAVRALDVLAAQPLVDPRRLASTGQSGGGTLTMLLAAVDDRLACAAVSCGNTENLACASFNPPGSTDDAEQNFIASGPLGFDRWDLLYPLAPKPLLVIASERDAFGTYSPNYIRSGEEEIAKLRTIYGVLGKPGNLEWQTTALPHALSHALRIHTYNFFERRLRGANRPVAEPEVRPEPDDLLLCGVKPARVSFAAPTLGPVAPASLRRLLRMDEPRPAVVTSLGRERGENCEIETIEVQSAPGVFLPAYLFAPLPSQPAGPLLLLLEPGGRTRQWREGGLCHALAAAGITVCAFDVRGIGDLTPEVGRGNSFYTQPHATEEAFAWASLMLGRPLLGQRARDIQAMAQAVTTYRNATRAILAAAGAMAVPALCAAVLEPSIQTAYLSGGLFTWASLIEGDEYTEPFANFLPGVLTQTDLPFLAKGLAPRRLVLAGAVDARGRAVAAELVQAAYGNGIEVRAKAEWSVEALSAL
ncbi:MAG: acetylxylan esterase [Bryobacterales bacterium]|nr:acetylxylan esterase [Bryobacterales bacterium]